MKYIVSWISIFIFFAQAYDELYAVKVGAMAHGTGPISAGREKGYDLNVELLWDDEIVYAAPAVGIELNNQGYTNFLYAGLAWEGEFFDFIVWELFFGGAIHDGKLKPTDGSRRALGSRVLFREAIALGFTITQRVTFSFIYDHYSHSGTDEGLSNQGNDNTGIRFGYYF